MLQPPPYPKPQRERRVLSIVLASIALAPYAGLLLIAALVSASALQNRRGPAEAFHDFTVVLAVGGSWIGLLLVPLSVWALVVAIRDKSRAGLVLSGIVMIIVIGVICAIVAHWEIFTPA